MKNLAILTSAFLCLTFSAQLFAKKQGVTYRKNKGVIVWQPEAFAGFSSEKEFSRIVKKARRHKVLRADASGSWSMHFIAFLKQPPRSTKLNLVWYRQGKKREQVDFTEFTVNASSRTLQAQATLSQMSGFKKGDVLEGRITRLIGGKEKVYARCKLKLK